MKSQNAMSLYRDPAPYHAIDLHEAMIDISHVSNPMTPAVSIVQ